MRALYPQSTLRAALRCLLTSDLPPEHKAVLVDAVVQTLLEREAAHHIDESFAEARAWEPQEVEELRTLLAGRIAHSWQEADELLTRCARQLERAPVDVREQAGTLGLDAAVDYRRARTTASER